MIANKFYVASAGALAIQTNIDGFAFSFGTVMPSATEQEFAEAKVRFKVEVGDVPPKPSHVQGKYHYFSGEPGEDRLYYERPWMNGSRLALEIEGLLTEEPTFRFNKPYYRWVRHRFMNLHSPGYILTDAACIRLLAHGLTPLHCSAFEADGEAVVVFAPPNTGKTLTSMQFCFERGAKFIAEDLAISDGRNVLAVPWTSTFRYYGSVDKSAKSRWRARLVKAFPPAELIAPSDNPRITDYIQAGNVANKSRVRRIVILERGQDTTKQLNPADALAKIYNLNRYEFKYSTSPFSVAYEYFNPALDLEGRLKDERNGIRDLLEQADTVHLLTAREATSYSSMVANL